MENGEEGKGRMVACMTRLGIARRVVGVEGVEKRREAERRDGEKVGFILLLGKVGKYVK